MRGPCPPYILAMTAEQAFATFVIRALEPARAARFAGLVGSDRGRRRLLRSLDHDFERALRPVANGGPVDRTAACHAYHVSVGFGAAFGSVAEAIARLGGTDGWLVILADGSAGIYRPEGRWDRAVEMVPSLTPPRA